MGNDINGEPRSRIYTCAVIFSILIGFSFLGIKVCINYANTIQILVHRYNVAFLAMLILVVTGFVKVKFKGKSKKNIIITSGGYIAFMGLQTWGLLYSTSIMGSILFAVIPIIAKIIAGVLLGEKSTGKENFFVTLSVTALIFMIVMGSGAGDLTFTLPGIILLVCSSMVMALSNVYMRFVRNEYSPWEICFMITIIGCIVFNLAYFVYAIKGAGYGEYFKPFENIGFTLAISYLGIACIIASSTLVAYMLKHLPAVKATIFGNVSTMISILAGVIILDEKLAWYHLVCAALIVTGVIGLSASGKGAKNGKKLK